MKKVKQLLMIVLLSNTFALFAQQKVALHSNGNTTIFSSTNPFIDAYNASATGDTIYLPGGSFTPPANFDKTLAVYGAGHYVDSSLVTGKTFINGNITLKENADGFHLEGLEINGIVTFYNNESVNNVVITWCKINNTFNVTGNLTNPSSNLSLIGNVFMQNIYLENAQTVLLSNNIIKSFMSSKGNMINNNIIMSYIPDYYAGNYLFYGDNNTINNNIIFWNDANNARVNGHGNVFQNNLYVVSAPNYGTNPTALNNYTGIPQADIFINQTGVEFDYTHDYHLQEPVTYLGTDGTQVGIYGGTFPYKEGAVPSNPHFQFKNIAPTTDINGDLNIQIQVEAQDN